MRRTLASLALLVSLSSAAQGASTIVPTIPGQNAFLSSAPIRQNFAAAFTDVNNLLGMFAGPTAPLNPTDLQRWADTSGASVTVLKVWNFTTQTWSAYAQINRSTGVYTTYMGAGSIAAVAPLSVSFSGGLATVSIVGVSGQVLGGSPAGFTATPTLGASGTLGSVTFGNASSGLVTVQPEAGALGNITLFLPASGGIDNLVSRASVDTLANKSLTSPILNDSVLATNIAAPATPAAGKTRVYVDSTQKTLSAKNDVGTISVTVVPSTAPANQFATGISAAGIFSYAQPDFTNLSGSIAAGQIPSATVTYAKIQNVAASRLLGNPTGAPAAPSEISLGATLAFSGTALQTAAHTGDVTTVANSFATTLANIPNDVPAAGDVLFTNTAAPSTPAAGKTRVYVDSTQKTLTAKNDTGSLSTTVFSSSAGANQFATGINTAGSVTYAQPAFSNLSGSISGGQIANSTITNAMLANMAAWTIKGNVTSGAAAPTDFTIDGLTLKTTPVSTDEVILWDVAGGAIKKATVSGITGASTGTVTSVTCGAGLSGGTFTTSGTCSTINVRNLAARCGSFDVWQRLVNGATTLAVAASATVYVNDGWYIATGATQAATLTQAAGIATGSLFAAKVQRNSGQTGTATIRYACPLDTDELALLRGSNIAFSFTAKEGANQSFSHSLTYELFCGTGAVAKRNGTAYTSETIVINTTATLSTTATRFQSTSAAVFPATCTQAEIQISVNPTGTAGADDSFTVDDLQLEIVAASTSVASPFMPADLPAQRAKAYKFLRVIAPALASAPIAAGQAFTTARAIVVLPLPITMRIIPTLSISAAGDFNLLDAGAAAKACTSLAFNLASLDAVELDCSVSGTPLVAGNATWMRTVNTSAALFITGEI